MPYRHIGATRATWNRRDKGPRVWDTIEAQREVSNCNSRHGILGFPAGPAGQRCDSAGTARTRRVDRTALTDIAAPARRLEGEALGDR